MTTIADRLRRAARRLIVVEVPDVGRLCYQVHRVSPVDLIALGLPEIPGAREAAAASEAALAALDEAQRLADAPSDDERAAVMAELARQRAHVLEGQIAALTSTPAQTTALLAHVDAVIAAAVEAVGIVRCVDGVYAAEVGVVAGDLSPADLCEPIDPSAVPVRYLEPLRLVTGPAGPGAVDLADLSEVERMTLFGLIGAAFGEAAKAAATFRGSRGRAPDPRHVGQAVRPATERAPVERPGERRDRSPGNGGWVGG
jgi:hypothetical protein